MSMTPPPSLPAENGIDALAFAKTLDKPSTSYKFLWLLAMLEILKARDYSVAAPIAFSEMAFAMLKRAKAPIRRFNLSFGASDQLREFLENIERQTDDENWDKSNSPPTFPAFNRACEGLMVYVPYRWIRPFVQKETAGARTRAEIHQAVYDALIKKSKSNIPPPYVLDVIDIGKGGGGDSVKVHPLWADYFRRNAEVIGGWCMWHLANFAHARNLNIPAVIAKLAADEDDRRNSLAEPRKFWREIFRKTGDMRCIYSGRELSTRNFALDHYVPWSFVGHDSMWNLIPAHPEVNSSKSDNLPDKRYLAPMVEAHHRALVVREEMVMREDSPQKWDGLLDSYVADLKLPREDLTDKAKLQAAYQDFIRPLIDLARANRFKAGWVWKSKTPLWDKGR